MLSRRWACYNYETTSDVHSVVRQSVKWPLWSLLPSEIKVNCLWPATAGKLTELLNYLQDSVCRLVEQVDPLNRRALSRCLKYSGVLLPWYLRDGLLCCSQASLPLAALMMVVLTAQAPLATWLSGKQRLAKRSIILPLCTRRQIACMQLTSIHRESTVQWWQAKEARGVGIA